MDENKMQRNEGNLTPEMMDKSLEIKVTDYIRRMGIPAHIKGYYYLRTAIMMVVKDISVFNEGVTKKLYPEVAKLYNTNSSRVERACRHAIETAYFKEEEFFLKLFGPRKPTNGEFIALIADQIRLS